MQRVLAPAVPKRVSSLFFTRSNTPLPSPHGLISDSKE